MTRRNDKAREILREGYAAGDPVYDIAKRAGITYGSAKVIAHQMGLRHPGRPKPPVYGTEVSRRRAIALRAAEGARRTLEAFAQ